ncbi:MAG TPA: hypothetical protein VKU41_08495 [Polyangiaceae bacterium]|nr:hypothetical protein [Polyangiaceae bacterium]
MGRCEACSPSGSAGLVGVVLTLLATPCAADGAAFDDPYDVPAAPRPPTLPELTHREIEGTLEETAGAILPNPGGQIAHAFVQRLAIEVPLGLRRWFLGAGYEVAGGGGSNAFRVVGGNLEIQGRTLWATRTGLAFGGGLGLVLPTASFDENGLTSEAALNAATLRPWDVAFFVPDSVGFRPVVDVRAVDGAFVAQFRQGLELMVPPGAPSNRRIYATTGVYFGWWVTREVAGGLEAFEAYVIDAPNVRDGERAAVVISPSVRLALPWVQPAVSIFTNIGTPLQGASDRIWGFRVAFTVLLKAFGD